VSGALVDLQSTAEESFVRTSVDGDAARGDDLLDVAGIGKSGVRPVDGVKVAGDGIAAWPRLDRTRPMFKPPASTAASEPIIRNITARRPAVRPPVSS
jgi:hypothetical protein